jgi:hypothetical protein
MQALFVHGMGRSSISGWPLLRHLRKTGIKTSSFGYFVSTQSFEHIQLNLAKRIAELASGGDYILIGHSLGGVLIRAAMNSLPTGTAPPQHIFLLGSPVIPARLARMLASNVIFRAVTRDCGHLLGSQERMQRIGIPHAPVTGIAGTKEFSKWLSPFGGEPNDGIVSLSEVSAEWLTGQIRLPIIHSVLPSSRRVAHVILTKIGRGA